ncbi:MAG: metalloregulator ArsR/SmtB family transcription factor [Actinomycetota bacterium]
MNDPAVDRSFHALAHPVRRRIVERLARGPASVAEATRDIPLSKPAVSKHLKVLEGAGLVTRRIDGRRHHLTLVSAPLADADDWLRRHREMWEGTLDRLERLLAAGDAETPAG